MNWNKVSIILGETNEIMMVLLCKAKLHLNKSIFSITWEWDPVDLHGNDIDVFFRLWLLKILHKRLNHQFLCLSKRLIHKFSFKISDILIETGIFWYNMLESFLITEQQVFSVHIVYFTRNVVKNNQVYA